MPKEGLQVRREGNANKLDGRNKFLEKVIKIKYLVKYQIRVVRKSIPKPWYEVVVALIKYITLEGRYKVLLASHFYLLNHFTFLETNRVKFPFFIFNSMLLSINKVKRNRALIPLHAYVIKLVYESYREKM